MLSPVPRIVLPSFHVYVNNGFGESEINYTGNDGVLFKEHGLEDYANFEKTVWEILKEERFSKDLEFLHPSWGAFFQNDIWNAEFQIALIISLIITVFIRL